MSNKDELFKVRMDKVFTYRMSNRQNEALQYLVSFASESETKNQNLISKWRCQLENEILLNNKTISPSEFAERIMECPKTLNTKPIQNVSTISEKQMIQPQNNENNQVTIYPNPSYGRIHISSNDLIKSLMLYDITGKLVYEQVMTQPSNRIELNTELGMGVFLTKVIFINGKIGNGKVILVK